MPWQQTAGHCNKDGGKQLITQSALECYFVLLVCSVFVFTAVKEVYFSQLFVHQTNPSHHIACTLPVQPCVEYFVKFQLRCQSKDIGMVVKKLVSGKRFDVYSFVLTLEANGCHKLTNRQIRLALIRFFEIIAEVVGSGAKGQLPRFIGKPHIAVETGAFGVKALAIIIRLAVVGKRLGIDAFVVHSDATTDSQGISIGEFQPIHIGECTRIALKYATLIRCKLKPDPHFLIGHHIACKGNLLRSSIKSNPGSIEQAVEARALTTRKRWVPQIAVAVVLGNGIIERTLRLGCACAQQQ